MIVSVISTAVPSTHPLALLSSSLVLKENRRLLRFTLRPLNNSAICSLSSSKIQTNQSHYLTC